jgi:hypothetical protein
MFYLHGNVAVFATLLWFWGLVLFSHIIVASEIVLLPRYQNSTSTYLLLYPEAEFITFTSLSASS